MVRPTNARDLPYIESVPTDGRKIVFMPFYDVEQKQFHAYAQQQDGSFFAVRPRDLISGSYVSRTLADSTRDLHLPLSELVFQHFSTGGILPLLEQIENDLLNGLSSVHKYFILLEQAQRRDDGTAGSLISTEIEYAIGNHRSFYDLINRLVIQINSTHHPTPKQLKDSFAKLAQKDLDYLCTELSLPEPIAQFYVSRAEIFLLLRDLRDNIFHHGHSPNTIFIGNDGFSIRVHDRFGSKFHSLNLWPDELQKPNQLGSVLAILERIVFDIFDTMSVLANSVSSSFTELPAPVADRHSVFLRSNLVRHYHMFDRYRRGHWFDPTEILDMFVSDADE